MATVSVIHYIYILCVCATLYLVYSPYTIYYILYTIHTTIYTIHTTIYTIDHIQMSRLWVLAGMVESIS